MKTPDTTTLPQSNINNVALAKYLSEQRDGATFSAVIYHKVGKTVRDKRYGDDTVLDTIVTGFDYHRLCEKDLATLEELTPEQLHAAVVESGRLDKNGHVPSVDACKIAIEAQKESFRKTLAGTNKATTDHVREPVIVDGKRIQGCWVNNGQVDRGKTGIPYLYGLRVGRKVLEEAENGPIPPSKSRPDVVAKDVLKRKFLRVGRWCQVKLDPSTDFILKLGGEAAAMADDRGVKLTENVSVREVYEAA